MTAVFCRNTADRKAATWEKELAPFSRLEFAVSDAAKGIAAAVARRAEARRDDPSAPALEHGLDVFHTAQEANRVLATHWRRAEAVWEKAEAADAKVAEAKRQGIDARGPGLAAMAHGAWDRARAAFEQAQRLQSAWDRARGRWTSSVGTAGSTTASPQRPRLAAAREDLTGPDWSKVCNFLEDRRSLAFLDRMHRRLESAEPRAEWCAAMAWRWWLRHGRVGPSDPVTELLRGVARDRELDGEERASYERGGGGAGSHIPSQQRRGMHEQRVADATISAPADDPADARPEAAVLEYPSVPLGSEEGSMPLPGTGPGTAHL